MTQPRSRRRSTILFTRTVRLLIVGADIVLGGVFISIQFNKLPLGIFANNMTPLLLWHGGLALYYLSWIVGTRFDLSIQEEVYEEGFPRRGKVPVHGLMIVLLLAVVGFALLWTERSIQKFAIALNTFIVVDHLAWIYLMWLLKGIISECQSVYMQEKRYYDLERLNIVTQQIQGNWKWLRFTGTLPIVILINAFAFSGAIHSYLIVAATKLPLHSLSYQDISEFISGALLLSFVLVAEIWHWVMRIKTKVALKIIDELSDRYELRP